MYVWVTGVTVATMVLSVSLKDLTFPSFYISNINEKGMKSAGQWNIRKVGTEGWWGDVSQASLSKIGGDTET